MEKNGETGHHSQTPVCIFKALPPLGISTWVRLHACGLHLCFKRPGPSDTYEEATCVLHKASIPRKEGLVLSLICSPNPFKY